MKEGSRGPDMLTSPKAFSMLPYSIYRSSRTDMAGNPVDLGIAERGKTVLTASGKERIQGVQAQLFLQKRSVISSGWNIIPFLKSSDW